MQACKCDNHRIENIVNEIKNKDPDAGLSGVTRYQWLVLLIASLGWVFDVFEGQIFVASMREAMPSLVPEGTSDGTMDYYYQITLAMFLLGGATGGVFFGMLSDRIGRTKTMSLTILMYSFFTCFSAFSQEWWHMAIFRFLVAMGVGGEWAVASSMVAEEFPTRIRAKVSGIFHASSIFGTWLAILVATFLIGNESIQAFASEMGYPTAPWRIGFGIGVLPALLIIWIRRSLREPESWRQAQERAADGAAEPLGHFTELFRGTLLRSTLVGVTLAAVGLATFWGAHIYGKDLLRRDVEKSYIAQENGGNLNVSPEDRAILLEPYKQSIVRWEMLGMFLVTTGGGAGLLSFGPLSERIGRRGAFMAFHAGALVASLILFQLLEGITVLIIALPIFGFLTLGMHAGYAIYFPELFPTRLRGTGAGFCFNFGRIIAAPILVIRGLLRKVETGGGLMTMEDAASILCLLFVLGIIIPLFATETKGKDLPT